MASMKKRSHPLRKVALIITIKSYDLSDNLVNDSAPSINALAAKLKKLEFDVKAVCDLGKHDMITKIIKFIETVKSGDLVLFYFSGHMYPINNKNYLIPAGDAQIKTSNDVPLFAIDLEEILGRFVEKNQSFVTLCIVDCPGTYRIKNMSTSSGNSSCCEMNTIDRAFVQFACGVAETDSNHLFMRHLLNNISKENLHVGDLFRTVASGVAQESNGHQHPLSIDGLQQYPNVYLNYVRVPPAEAAAQFTRQFLTDEPLSEQERIYYDSCKEYYRLTKQPLISISDGVLQKDAKLSSLSLNFGVDESCQSFDLSLFLQQICKRIPLTLEDITVRKIRQHPTIVETEILNKFELRDKKVRLRMIYSSLTDEQKKMFGQMQVFFMSMGPVQSSRDEQNYRTIITMYPEFNRTYGSGSGETHWKNALDDGRNRGGKPYFCPVGWYRWSFYVTDNFEMDFAGWCIGYHGTKFTHGLSILLSGLRTADITAHGRGIYLTPSINYAAHPRYAEVREMSSEFREKFSRSGRFIQFVLECRVQPSNIKKVGCETLLIDKRVTIDSNISNLEIEWLIDDQSKSLVDFSDPNGSIVCTGLMLRTTNEHPELLPESAWWRSVPLHM